MKKSTRILFSVLTSMLLVTIWLVVIDIENGTLESLGVGVIVFLSVMLFSDWKSESR